MDAEALKGQQKVNKQLWKKGIAQFPLIFLWGKA
jgi:ribosomal protein L31E